MPAIQEMLEFTESAQITEIFSKIYSTEKIVIRKQIERYQNLASKFQQHFNNSNVHLFSTPGRTEIGGNHTDHNAGRVLAGSVNLDSVAIAAKNEDYTVNIYSEGFSQLFKVDLSDLTVRHEEKGTTNSLIRGIAARLNELDYKIGGFNACITSNVMVGSGLSSSASIEVLLGTIFNTFYNYGNISNETLAIIGQYAENNYFGKPCGLMDQMTCAVGGIVTIDFRDANNPVVKKVDFDFNAQNYNLIVVDTGGSHADLTDDYASVPVEMKAVAQQLGENVGRELSYQQVIENVKELRSKVGDRAILRMLHFLGDNDRVVEQVNALENGDFKQFLSLVTESGNSSNKWLQNCFTVKAPAQQGVNLALAITENYIKNIGEGACRVHGGGFAGTIQVFLPQKNVAEYSKLMQNIFDGNSVLVLNIRPVGTLHITNTE